MAMSCAAAASDNKRMTKSGRTMRMIFSCERSTAYTHEELHPTRITRIVADQVKDLQESAIFPCESAQNELVLRCALCWERFSEQRDHLAIECRDVAGLAAR